MRPLIFRALDAVAADPGLSATERLTLLYVVRFADRDGTGCTASNQTIARNLHVEISTVRRAVAVLVARGYLERRRRPNTSAVTTVRLPEEARVPVPEEALVPVPGISEEAPAHAGRGTSARPGKGTSAPVPALGDLPSTCRTESERPPARGGFVPPELAEVKAEAADLIEADGLVGLEPGAVARAFFDHFAAAGWKMGRTVMVDWRPRLRRWCREDAARVREGAPRPVNGSARQQVGTGPGPGGDDGDGWAFGTYRVADRERHHGEPGWAEYIDAAAGMPPRTAPPFAAWMAARGGAS